MIRLRGLERNLLEDISGVPYDLSRDFRLAMQERTMKFDDKGYIIPLNRGGGIDDHEWHITMTRFIENYNSLDDGQVNSVRKLFGTINLDLYSPAQLVRKALFAQKDPATIKRFQDNDFQAQFIDAMDRNGSSTDTTQYFDNDGLSLFFEITAPSAMYRKLVTLREEYGVVSSTLGINLHGHDGGLEVASKYLISAQADASADEQVNTIYIAKTNVARLFRDYMKPHSKSGLRNVILSSCNQAVPGVGNTPSLAEALALSSPPEDNVVVSASKESISLEADGQHVHFINDKDRRSIIYHFRNRSEPAISTTISNSINVGSI